MYLFKLDATDSTNSFLREMSKNKDLGKWTAVTANFQRQGRGQKNAVWHSENGKNLICSILLRFEDMKAEHQFLINCAVSLGIHQYLQRYHLPKLSVKWPNDIMSVSKKLGGILIENTLSGDKITNCIIGIGINLNQETFPEDLPMAVSIKQLTGQIVDKDVFLQDLLNSIQNKFELVFDKKNDALRDAYEKVLFRKDKVHMFQEASGNKIMGIIRGVSKEGQLLLEHENGSIHKYNFKEVVYL
ncbi:biotin--[acetyl-CoA-carboxylase] ligase [Lutimonas sp.]|uniref:biotin--[acetyl-CoA-carboxylase] ligase n=1 Tax=Lutimonas sp. TaxID=1872403 RepID=UPI003D9B6AF9